MILRCIDWRWMINGKFKYQIISPVWLTYYRPGVRICITKQPSCVNDTFPNNLVNHINILQFTCCVHTIYPKKNTFHLSQMVITHAAHANSLHISSIISFSPMRNHSRCHFHKNRLDWSMETRSSKNQFLVPWLQFGPLIIIFIMRDGQAILHGIKYRDYMDKIVDSKVVFFWFPLDSLDLFLDFQVSCQFQCSIITGCNEGGIPAFVVVRDNKNTQSD